MKRLLIVAAATGYQTRSLEKAACELGLQTTLATDRCHVLEDPWGDRAIPIRFEDADDAVAALVQQAGKQDGVVAVGDRPTIIAAMAARKLSLRYHSLEAVEVCRNKYLARERFRTAGLLVPEYFRVPLDYDPPEAARSATYPCVLKPLGLSGSRGVIRANDEVEFQQSFERIRTLLDSPDIRRMHQESDGYLQVESFIPGREFALEGLMTDGSLKVLAIFDKPDPLDGPFFEETIYVTPARITSAEVEAIASTTAKAAAALGLTTGPIHAEMRVNDSGVWMLEIAARPIGGLCAQSLRFEGGMQLEELLIRHALGEDVRELERERCASGVMMIPIPEKGIYADVAGLPEAAAVPFVEDVVITATRGQSLQKLPEGSSYLGFIFARANDSSDVERALRAAHSQLRFEIIPQLAVFRAS